MGQLAINEGVKNARSFLTIEERADFFQLKAQLLQSELYGDLSGHEYKRIYQKASDILLVAVDRELAKRGLA